MKLDSVAAVGYCAPMGLMGYGVKMKRMLPNRTELGVMAGAAMVGAAILVGLAGHELSVPAGAFPVILVSMLLGARRTGQL